MTDVVIVDSGGANLASLSYALERLGASSRLSVDPELIRTAPRVILPGVGAAAPAMARLNGLGLVEPLRTRQRPLLGICLGMQLLFERSDEGDTPTLGCLPGAIRALTPRVALPVPHMGWNTLSVTREDPLLEGLGSSAWFYFVHGYHAPADHPAVVAITDYGMPLGAVVRRGVVCGVQFHPERSAEAGQRLLRNFIEQSP